MLNARRILAMQKPHRSFRMLAASRSAPTTGRSRITTTGNSILKCFAPDNIRDTRRSCSQQRRGLCSTLSAISSSAICDEDDDALWNAPFYKARNLRDKSCWRPTVADVERISWGLPAKIKGTGSRGVPHRLNADERALFDMARRKGFLEVSGSAWRSQRRDAPLLNTYRSLCDARGQVAIVLHKTNAIGTSNSGELLLDRVVMDLSPLRLSTTTLDYVTTQILREAYDDGTGSGRVLGDEVIEMDDSLSLEADEGISETDKADDDADDTMLEPDSNSDARTTRPIYQLPSHCIQWELPRPDAKSLGKKLATVFNTAENKKGSEMSPSKKPGGVKPGKSRRSGGYGIG